MFEVYIKYGEGMEKIQLQHVLRRYANYTPYKAKVAVDSILDGREVTVAFTNREDATYFKRYVTITNALVNQDSSTLLEA